MEIFAVHNGMALFLSTLCSPILFTYISKICMQRIQNKFRFDVGQRSIIFSCVSNLRLAWLLK